jgi:5'-3' exonuclease
MGVSDKPTLMLLDGNSLAFRAFYALPAENFKTKNGLTTNAVYGFTAMLINLLRDEAPTHIAAAFDVSRQTFRSERFPEYKATRSATPSGDSNSGAQAPAVTTTASAPTPSRTSAQIVSSVPSLKCSGP